MALSWEIIILILFVLTLACIMWKVSRTVSAEKEKMDEPNIRNEAIKFLSGIKDSGPDSVRLLNKLYALRDKATRKTKH